LQILANPGDNLIDGAPETVVANEGLARMDNPYFELHSRFRRAGAEVLLSSGQACVAFGIAAFSKDGDWIVREDDGSCDAVRAVLAQEGAQYRLGAPLSPEWLRLGLTSHFEYRNEDGVRVRTDFCSRPPRVPDLNRLWKSSVRAGDLDLVDIESLIRLKQTRRLRDYAVIGALAEVAGLDYGLAGVALSYLQDYALLSQAVERWPEEARQNPRPAVRLLTEGAPRREVVTALALEQDALIQQDEERIQSLMARVGDFPERFAELRREWRRDGVPLPRQHEQLMELATCLLNPNRPTGPRLT